MYIHENNVRVNNIKDKYHYPNLLNLALHCFLVNVRHNFTVLVHSHYSPCVVFSRLAFFGEKAIVHKLLSTE